MVGNIVVKGENADHLHFFFFSPQRLQMPSSQGRKQFALYGEVGSKSPKYLGKKIVAAV